MYRYTDILMNVFNETVQHNNIHDLSSESKTPLLLVALGTINAVWHTLNAREYLHSLYIRKLQALSTIQHCT